MQCHGQCCCPRNGINPVLDTRHSSPSTFRSARQRNGGQQKRPRVPARMRQHRLIRRQSQSPCDHEIHHPPTKGRAAAPATDGDAACVEAGWNEVALSESVIEAGGVRLCYSGGSKV